MSIHDAEKKGMKIQETQHFAVSLKTLTSPKDLKPKKKVSK